MSSQFAGRFWKWVVPAGITVGLLGLWAPAGADDEKDVDVKKVVIKKDGDEERKDGERKDVKKEGERKEEGRKDEDRKDEPRKGEGKGHNDARIDELSKIVKQLAGQVNELREEVRGLRSGGFAGGTNPEEMRKRMDEMAKKFGAGFPGGGLSPEKMKEEMERRFKEQKDRFAKDSAFPGADAEAQIRREIERLQGELKRISAAREGGDKKEGGDKREGGDKIEKKEFKKDLGEDEARAAKEWAAKEAKLREAKEREADEREANEKEAKAREAKERAAKEAKEREAKERDAKEDKK